MLLEPPVLHLDGYPRLLEAVRAVRHASDLELMQLALRRSLDLRRLSDLVRLGEDGRCRITLWRGPHVELVLLGLAPGRASPWHRGGSGDCFFRVLRGRADELRSWPDGRLTEHVHLPGSVVLLDRSLGHGLTNVSAATEPLVTLHVYSPSSRLGAHQQLPPFGRSGREERGATVP